MAKSDQVLSHYQYLWDHGVTLPKSSWRGINRCVEEIYKLLDRTFQQHIGVTMRTFQQRTSPEINIYSDELWELTSDHNRHQWFHRYTYPQRYDQLMEWSALCRTHHDACNLLNDIKSDVWYCVEHDSHSAQALHNALTELVTHYQKITATKFAAGGMHCQ